MELTIHDISGLSAAAAQLIGRSGDKRIFALQGPMGAGKTTFVKAICGELGVKDTVSSPTFSIVNEYHTATGEKVFHFDFYRIRDISEAYDMGYEEYLYSGAWCFIEWPEKVAELLPPETQYISILPEGKERVIRVE